MGNRGPSRSPSEHSPHSQECQHQQKNDGRRKDNVGVVVPGRDSAIHRGREGSRDRKRGKDCLIYDLGGRDVLGVNPHDCDWPSDGLALRLCHGGGSGDGIGNGRRS